MECSVAGTTTLDREWHTYLHKMLLLLIYLKQCIINISMTFYYIFTRHGKIAYISPTSHLYFCQSTIWYATIPNRNYSAILAILQGSENGPVVTIATIPRHITKYWYHIHCIRHSTIYHTYFVCHNFAIPYSIPNYFNQYDLTWNNIPIIYDMPQYACQVASDNAEVIFPFYELLLVLAMIYSWQIAN
jgi:hypothetical protein